MNDVIDSSLGSDSATSAVDALPGQVGQTRRPFSGLGSTMTGTGTTTGSWAESTHSVIWLTRGGNRLPLARVGRRSWGTNLISVAVIALTSLIAASNLLDVYGSAAMWAVAAVPATLLGALIAYAGTAPALRLWWQIVFLIVAQGVIGPVIALNDTAISHVIPSVETLSQGFVSTFGAFKYLIAIPPPTGSGDGSLMAAWTICLWLSFLAGVFAIGDKRQLSVLSLLPIAIELVVCALLGTQTGFQPIASGVLIGLIMIVWLSWRWQLLELGRWISATIILLLAAGLGVGACMGIGQSRLILRDYYDPPLSPYDYASPLSGLRSYVKDHKDDTLLTVTNLPEGTPVRLAVMDQFDGNVWNLSDSTEASDSSDYRRVGTRIPNTVDGKKFTATFTIDKGLSDKWLPLAGAASSVDVTSAGKTGGANGNGGGESRSSAGHTLFYYNESTQSAIIPAGLSTGMTYTESGIIAPTPTDKEIAKANAAVTNQPGTKDVPDSVGKFASSVAGGEDTAGAQAQALVAQLKDSGWFSHGLTGDYPSLPGHGSYRINALLAGSAMVGDSEQYASAMALMARELGLPSRVVMGFLPKNDDGDISNGRTETVNGTSTVKFTGNDIEAWVEINLEGYGWVAFYPTPKETKIPDDNQNLTPPNPQTLVRQPPVPLTDRCATRSRHTANRRWPARRPPMSRRHPSGAPSDASRRSRHLRQPGMDTAADLSADPRTQDRRPGPPAPARRRAAAHHLRLAGRARARRAERHTRHRHAPRPGAGHRTAAQHRRCPTDCAGTTSRLRGVLRPAGHARTGRRLLAFRTDDPQAHARLAVLHAQAANPPVIARSFP